MKENSYMFVEHRIFCKSRSDNLNENLVRPPLKRTPPSKDLEEKGSDEIKSMEENGSASKANPELTTSDESNDNTKNHKQEQTQLMLDNEKKIKTSPPLKVIKSLPSKISTSLCGIRVFCILVFVLVAIIAIYFQVASDSYVTEPQTNGVVEALQQSFKGQSALSLKIIEKSINKIINDAEPPHPSILLLMSSKGANEIGNLFAKELARLISLSETNYLTIYCHDLNDTNADNTKKLIDGNIKSACDKQRPAVVLLQDLDMLPALSATILHSYCDHENAPYKKAVFIMTISIGEVIPKSANSKVLDSLAETHLRQSWHMTDDLLAPLLSRITVSVAGIFEAESSK